MKISHLIASLVAATAVVVPVVNTAVDHGKPSGIVGVWDVEARGAPYAPHLFTFHADGTMTTTNPTNVQERADRPHGGTNDSLGMGLWTQARGKGNFTGAFWQKNAFADTHLPAGDLEVRWTITVTGDTFFGHADATQDGETHPADLIGTRKRLP